MIKNNNKENISKLAILSFILGIITIFFPIIALLPIIAGIIAIRQISKKPKLAGRRYAIIGIITGCLPFALFVVFMLAASLSYLGISLSFDNYDLEDFILDTLPTWGCSIFSDDIQMRDNCLLTKAIKNNDPRICENMDNPLKCYSYFEIPNFHTDLCLKASAQYSYCMYQVAVARNNETLCNYSNEWKEYCYWDIAVQRRNISLCPDVGGKIGYSVSNYSCFAAILNSSLCESDPDGEACLNAVAIARKDASLCFGLNDYSSCFTAIAKQQLNETLCRYAVAESSTKCYWIIAVKKQNISICEGTDSLKSYCIASIVGPEMCKYTSDKPRCYQNVAIAKNDKSLCRYAKDKASCRVNVEFYDPELLS